ncbi:MAG TPA: MauE/DoxX family redox-associated membrane protein [Acidimicrobiia bacterium]
MSAPVWSQVDAGVALTLGVIVETAAIRKLQRPRVFALTLQRLDPALSARRTLALRLAFVVAAYEAFVGAGVVAFRGVLGFAFAGALLVACAGFLAALARAVQRSVPCACFGRLGRTAAGGREIGRGIALVAAAAFLVVHRALDAGNSYGSGPVAVTTVVVTVFVIVVAQRIGATVRPGVELRARTPRGRGAFAGSMRTLTGYDNDLYTSGS